MRVFIILYIRDTFLIIYSLAPLLSMLFFFLSTIIALVPTHTHTIHIIILYTRIVVVWSGKCVYPRSSARSIPTNMYIILYIPIGVHA